MVDSGAPHVLLDVREAVEYRICHLPHSINVPLGRLHDDGGMETTWQHIKEASKGKGWG